MLIFRLQFKYFCVPSFQDLFVFRLVQKSPLEFFQTGSGVFPETPSAQAFDATTHHTPMHFLQVNIYPLSVFNKNSTLKAILDFHFLQITSLFGLLNCNQQNQQD